MSESKIDDGGSAFPHPDIPVPGTGGGFLANRGMTLRDYFAAAALQGMLSDGVFDFHVSDKIANDAYELADAMLERRKQ